MRILVVTPLKAELSTLMQQARNQSKLELIEVLSSSQKIWRDSESRVFFAVGGHGKVQFGIQTQHCIQYIKELTHIVIAGAGGALIEAVNPLDVVVSTEIVEHDYTEKFKAEAGLPRFRCDSSLIEKLKLHSSAKFKTYFAPTASGDEDIVDSVRAESLTKQTGALAVAWEGAGGARAARFNKLPFLEIRGITDNCRDDVPSQFEKNLPQAMKNVWDVIASIATF